MTSPSIVLHFYALTQKNDNKLDALPELMLATLGTKSGNNTCKLAPNLYKDELE